MRDICKQHTLVVCSIDIESARLFKRSLVTFLSVMAMVFLGFFLLPPLLVTWMWSEPRLKNKS